MSQHRLYLSMDLIKSKIENLAPAMALREFDAILGINRGGLVPAVMLSHKLGKPLAVLNHSLRDEKTFGLSVIDMSKTYLLVDDICDSGKTLKSLTHIKGPRFVVANCIDRHDLSIDFSAFTIRGDSAWIDFPWEY